MLNTERKIERERKVSIERYRLNTERKYIERETKGERVCTCHTH